MKRMLKKAVSVLLCLATLITAAPFSDLFATKAEAVVNWGDLGIDFSVNEYIAGIITNTNRNSCAISDDGKSIQSIDLDYYTQPQNVSLSKCYTEPLESDAQFMASVAAWEVLTFSPSDIYNESLNEIGYYQAILFEILNAAVDYNFIPSIVKSTNKHVISTVSAINKLGIKLDDIVVNGNTQWDLLKADQQHKIIQETAKHMNKLEMRGQDLSNISGIIETATTVIDYVEKTSQLYALTTLTEDVKTVINELSANSSFLDNPEMKTAISEIENAMISKFENIGTIGLELVGSGTKLAMDIFLSQMWGECVSAALGSLGAGLLIGQVIGRGLSNILFSTDETIKQFYMMQALADFEKLMCKSVKSLGAKYSSSPNSSSASAFLKSVDLLYNTYMLDFEYAADFAEILHEKGLVNKINLFLSGESKDLAKINSIVSSMKDTVSMTLGMLTDLDSYRWYLETDYPDVYAVYYGGLSIEDMTNRYIEKVRALTIACPTDVDIYNADNEAVVSVKNNEVKICMPGYFCVVEDDIKYLVISAESPSEVVITGTDEGEMTYSIYEADEHGFKRTIKFKNVELTKGCSFEADLPQNIRQASEKYVLISDEGKTIKPNFDTQPEINTEITDIIVSEELFEGFSTELIDKVANAMFKFEPVVDITSYNISTDDTVALFSAISKYYPTEYSLLTKGDFKYKIIFSPSLGCITDIRFYYGDDANLEAFEQRNKDLKAEIDKIVAQVEGMDDFEKALYIHDYIVLNSEYDLELLEILETEGKLTGELRSERYTEYSVLINGTGICGSYALAYRALMNAAGVDCLYLSSQQMNHAWNMVKIDGEWYHVDCCWDDPVPDTYGDARRTYFLRTDAEIMELNHYSWVPGTYKATSILYSDMPRNYNSKQKYDSGYWCYVSGGSVYIANEYGDNVGVVAENIYPASISYQDEELYYTNGRCVYRYYDDTNESVIVAYLYSADCGENPSSAYISNLYVDESANSATIYKKIYSEKTFKTVKSKVEFDEEKFSGIKGLSLSVSNLELAVFDTYNLLVEFDTSVSTNGFDLEWKTSDSSVATVDSKGKISGLNVGTAIITVECFGFVADCTVTVTGDGLSGSCGENAEWSFNIDTETLTISGSGDMKSYIWFANPPWYSIGHLIKKVSISNGITSIGTGAFKRCYELTEVYIGKDVSSIAVGLFQSCDKLLSIKVDENNLNYSHGENGVLFNKDKTTLLVYPLGCQNDKYEIPNTVKSISDKAFYESHYLKEIVITDNVENIGNNIFGEYGQIKRFIVVDNNSNYSSDEYGVLFDKNKTELIRYPRCSEHENYTIPETTVKISNNAFQNCSKLKNVIVSKSLTDIGEQAFYNCTGLESISDLWNITSIGKSAFYNCRNLKKLVLPNSLLTIGSNAFYGCDSIVDITIPNNVTSIGISAFEDCDNLASIIISDSVTEIASNSFADCLNLKKIIVGSKNQNYSSDEYGVLFDKNKTILIQFPCANAIESYKIPESVTKITGESFKDCQNLRKVILPSNITRIDGWAFSYCTSLTEITIPTSVTTIGNFAFEYCVNLKSITIPYSVTSTGEYVFSNCEKLENVTIQKGIKKLKDGLFYHCDSIKSITIPNSVTHIGKAFYSCENLKHVSIPKSVTQISQGAFSYSNNIVHIGYEGTASNWKSVDIGDYNEILTDVKFFHYNFSASDISAVANTEATCVQNGYTEGEYCGECKAWISGHEEIYAKGHNYRLESLIQGDCSTPMTETFKCSVCNDVYIKNGYVGEHDYVHVSSTPGSCITAPTETFTCSICQDTYTEIGSTDTYHSYTETVTAPTCTEIGYTTATCEHCGENAMYNFVPMLGHDVTVTHTDADCKKCAQTEYSCSRCDYHEIIVDEESGLGEHKISVTVTESTCTENGSIDRICVTCNELISSEEIISTGHVPGEWKTVAEATTESAGKKEQRCSVCTELLAEEVIPKIPVNVTGILLSESEIEISNKGTHLLTATVSPENADDRTVTWISDDPSVATVDENGLVTAVSIGETTVSVTTTDGGYTASCAVTVIPREVDITWVVGENKTVETYKEGSLLKKPSDPVRTGYTFTGWTPEVPDIMPEEDLTFTAVFESNTYNVIFDANGGKWADGAAEKTVPTAFDSQITAPEAPVKQGYIFSKWSSEVGVMDSVDGKKFAAEWIAATDTRYTVETYTMNTSGEYVKTTNAFKGTTGESVSVNPTVQTGFTLNKSKSVLSGNVAADNSLVLKVYIDRNTYTLTTVADGVSTSTKYLYGSLIAEPATPVKTGYKFIKWDKTLPETMPAKNITLTAVFDTAYTCPDCGDEIVGESAIAEHIAAEARAKSTVSIKNNPDTKTIKYGETLRLTAIASKPDDVVICWYVDGAKKGEGTTFDLKFESGTKTVEVKLEDADGNTVCNPSGAEISDSEEVTVNAGFFQKIISFFKNLFRMDRTVIQ